MRRFFSLILCSGLLLISANSVAGGGEELKSSAPQSASDPTIDPGLLELFDSMEVAKPEDLTPDKIMLPVGLTIAEFEIFEKRFPTAGESYNKAICHFKDELLQHYRVGDFKLANTSIASTQRQRSHSEASKNFTYGYLSHEEHDEYKRDHESSYLLNWSKWRKSHMLPNGLTVEEFDEFEEESNRPGARGKKYGMNLCLFKDYLIWHYRNSDFSRKKELHWQHPNFR